MIPETRRDRAAWTASFVLAVVLFLTASAALLPGCRMLPPIDTRITTALESIVFVNVPGAGSGSGFVIASVPAIPGDTVPEGKWRTLVVTAGHVLGLPRPIYGSDAFGNDLGPGRAYWHCPDFDIAVIEYDTDKQMAAMPLRREAPRAGEHVWLAGFPWGQPACICEGYVGDPRVRNLGAFGEDVENGIVTIVLHGNPGNSGSAVFDDNGEVVGVLTLGLGGGGVNGVIEFAAPGCMDWIEHILALEPPYWSRRCGNGGIAPEDRQH